MLRTLSYTLLILLTFSACKRTSIRDLDRSMGAVEDELRAEALFIDMFCALDEAVSQTQGIRAITTVLSCATLTADTLANPKTLVIDFGSSNCTGLDGRIRRGQLYCTFNGGKFSDSLCVATVYPLNYYVNDHKVGGALQLTYEGRNAQGIPQYHVQAINGFIHPADESWQINWDADLTLIRSSGSITSSVADDVYSITGTASGTGRHGDAFTMTTNSALYYDWGCQEIVSGSSDVVPANINIRHIDYGNSCDGLVQVGIQDYVFQIHNMY